MAIERRRNKRPHVVIVGGGFGGLYAAKQLKGKPVRVTIVDRRNHHLFQPLLYQVASAALSPGEIAVPIRGVFRHQRNVRVFLAEVTTLDLERRRIQLADDVGADGSLSYDFLILAPGASHSYFGHDEWEPLAPGLKTIEDALEIRRRILLAFERAERESDPAARRALLTFVVIGAGPTGVELAGALAEISRQTLANDFRAIDPTQARILLLEGGPRVLPPYPEDLSVSALKQLEAIGVEVRTGAIVTDVKPDAVFVGEERIETRTVLWAAGVQASQLVKSLGASLDRAGRVIVEPELTIPGHPEVFVIGDAAVYTHQGEKPLPGVAQVAIQMGVYASDSIVRTIEGEARERFSYWDKGNMATIGRAAAVADAGFVHLSGLIAWLAWLLIHVYYLIGFGNRVIVLLRWAWAYVTFQRGARLITGERRRSPS
ncbi:MAG: NAD(P)/FAD-dependent oxidoreductase [Chloroflexi bacterium]|nr:NAD(P)/FAD-dependent oxidoreductase [Chloroflexota bacterium]